MKIQLNKLNLEFNKTSKEYTGTGKPQEVEYDALVGTKNS